MDPKVIESNINKLRQAQFIMKLVKPLCDFNGLRGLRGLQVSSMVYEWVWDHTYLDDLIDLHNHNTGFGMPIKAQDVGSAGQFYGLESNPGHKDD